MKLRAELYIMVLLGDFQDFDREKEIEETIPDG
jgi:hypothetical protein